MFKVHHREIRERLGVKGRHVETFFKNTEMDYYRIAVIINCLLDTWEVNGDTAEIGVGSGHRSRMIAMLNNGVDHFACDTFQGLIDCEKDFDGRLKNGLLTFDYDEVSEYLKNNNNIRLVKCQFPKEAPIDMAIKKYKFVHIDVDTYRSTKASLKYFHGKMEKGGILVCDDAYSGRTPGANIAFKEFLKEETITGPVLINRPQAVLFYL